VSFPGTPTRQYGDELVDLVRQETPDLGLAAQGGYDGADVHAAVPVQPFPPIAGDVITRGG